MPIRSALLPPLAAFAAAARQQNFARAAEELHLTASAVSHQVRKLELTLGVTLFRRHARGVVLTPQGRELADAADSAIADLGAVIDALRRGRRSAHVRLSVLPSFGSAWLIPRLSGFAAAHPDVLITLDANRAVARFDDGGPDLGIRYGVAPWPGLVARFLMDDTLLPLASPMLAGIADVREPRDIAQLRLINDGASEGWREWFRAAKADKVHLGGAHVFMDSANSLDAAAGGLGAVLARKRLAAKHLADGSLIRLPGPELPARNSYFIVYPTHRRLNHAAAAFIAWLEREAQGREPLVPKPAVKNPEPAAGRARKR